MITRPKVIKVAPDSPAPEAIATAASTINAGGVIVYPTRCLYGLGADAFNDRAVDKIFSLKQRSVQKPILILIDHARQLTSLVTHLPEIAKVIMRQFWPGKVTIVFYAADKVLPNLTAGSGKIGVRLPGHPIASALVKAAGRPITGTSANLSGNPGCHLIRDLEPAIARHLDLILDAGPLEKGHGSTVVDVTDEIHPVILREGVVSERDIMRAVNG